MTPPIQAGIAPIFRSFADVLEREDVAQAPAKVRGPDHWDQIEEIGSVAGGDAEVRFFAGGRLAAVATLGRDMASLQAAERLKR